MTIDDAIVELTGDGDSCLHRAETIIIVLAELKRLQGIAEQVYEADEHVAELEKRIWELTN